MASILSLIVAFWFIVVTGARKNNAHGPFVYRKAKDRNQSLANCNYLVNGSYWLSLYGIKNHFDKKEVRMKFVRFLRGKLVAAAIVGIVIVGGATAAFAATPAGQDLVHAITGPAHAKVTSTVDSQAGNPHANNHQANNDNKNTCPGLPDAQRLAGQFALGTASTSDDIQALCALHQGTFTGTTLNGASVSSKRVFGYGEIDALLTYAQFLAGQDKANAGGKLTSANARGFLAEAVQSCGTTPLVTCLKTNMPGFEPGNSNDTGHGNGHGKPSSTPTPHH